MSKAKHTPGKWIIEEVSGFNEIFSEIGTPVCRLAVDAVAYDHKDSHEHSRMKAGKFAEGWLQGVGEELKEATHE